MPGALPEAAVEDLRGAHLEVAVLAIDAAHVLLDLLPERPALQVPEHEARRFLLHVEEIELRAEAPVVALLRLLEHLEIRVLVLLACPRGAVDALEHSFLESPRQYAPATRISLKVLSLPVEGTCGPRHRSIQSPWP